MEQPVSYLFFQSHIKLQGRKSHHVLQPLVKVATRLYKKLQISGVLGYWVNEQAGHIELIHYIEGLYHQLEDVFSKIQQDNQYQEVKLLFEGKYPSRLFKNWAMQVIDLQNYPFLASHPQNETSTKVTLPIKPRLIPITMQNFQIFMGKGSYDMDKNNIPFLKSSIIPYWTNNRVKATHTAQNLGPFQWNEKNFSALISQLQKDYQKQTQAASYGEQEWDDDQPMWVQNRKLLVRVFIIWIILVTIMLINVFSNASLF